MYIFKVNKEENIKSKEDISKKECSCIIDIALSIWMSHGIKNTFIVFKAYKGKPKPFQKDYTKKGCNDKKKIFHRYPHFYFLYKLTMPKRQIIPNTMRGKKLVMEAREAPKNPETASAKTCSD